MTKRVLLEVLKFASVEDILQQFSLVCRLWQATANEDELWYELHEGLALVPNLSIKESLHIRLQRCLVLAVLLQDSIRIHDYRRKEERLIPLVGIGQFTWNSAHAFMSQTKLLTCGHQVGAISAESFTIDCDTGEISQVQNMNVARVGHGLIVVRDFAYAIGGYEMVKTGERWNVSERTPWQLLPTQSQSPHSWFTATSTQQFIYICGGCTAACEQLNISTLVFTSIGFTLPEHNNRSAHAVEHNGYLVIITQKQVHVCHLATQRSESAHFFWNEDAWSNAPAVIYKGKIYSVRDERDKIREIDLHKLARTHTLLAEALIS